MKITGVTDRTWIEVPGHDLTPGEVVQVGTEPGGGIGVDVFPSGLVEGVKYVVSEVRQGAVRLAPHAGGAPIELTTVRAHGYLRRSKA